jgi:hypothetical protein
MILDVGPTAVEALADVLKTCRTLVWNGPLGAFETPPFDAATVALAKTAAALSREGVLTSVAGGGDTVAALNHAGAAQDFTYISTAGGAFLEWMEAASCRAWPRCSPHEADCRWIRFGADRLIFCGCYLALQYEFKASIGQIGPC